jgi:hypothetical protein
MAVEFVSPIQTCEIPEGFTREELKQFGWCLLNKKVQINYTRNFAKLGGTGSFHIAGRKFDKWASTLEEAVAIARQA